MVRRKPGTLLPLEVAILDAGTACAREGDPEFHGFAVAESRPRRRLYRITPLGARAFAEARAAEAPSSFRPGLVT